MIQYDKYNKLLILDSKKQSVSEIEPLISSVREIIPFSDDIYYNIIIAATEAVNNAIIHGNRLDSDKKVKIELDVSDNTICLMVEDEGVGFDASRIEDPRSPDNLLKIGGRGVFLINKLADSAEFVRGNTGMLIKMYFHI